jgi:hypothetical protein
MGLNPKVILLVDDSGDTCGRGRYRAICPLRRLQKAIEAVNALLEDECDRLSLKYH